MSFDLYKEMFFALRDGAFGSVLTIGLAWWFISKPASRAVTRFNRCVDRLEEYITKRSDLDDEILTELRVLIDRSDRPPGCPPLDSQPYLSSREQRLLRTPAPYNETDIDED